MTLIVTAANEDSIHQSSDFRLTGPTGRSTQDELGSKQLQASVTDGQAQIAITGLARFGTIRTLDWAQQAIQPSRTLDDMREALRVRSNQECLRFGRRPLGLTIVVAALLKGHGSRIIVISNQHRPDGDATSPRRQFDSWTQIVRRPVVVVHGMEKCLDRSRKRLLRKALERGDAVDTIQAELKKANEMAAKKSGGVVSEGCWVTSLWREGASLHAKQINASEVPGIPRRIQFGVDAMEWIRENVRAAPGKRLVMSSSVAVSGPARRSPPPRGEVKCFKIEVVRRAWSFGPKGRPQIAIEVDGSANLALKCNELVDGRLGSIRVRVPPNADWAMPEQPLFDDVPLRTDVLVDGRPIPGWEGFKARISSDGATFRVRLLTTSLSARNEPYLGPCEEVLLRAPLTEAVVEVTPGGTSEAELRARFSWRTWPETWPD